MVAVVVGKTVGPPSEWYVSWAKSRSNVHVESFDSRLAVSTAAKALEDYFVAYQSSL